MSIYNKQHLRIMRLSIYNEAQFIKKLSNTETEL